MPLNLQGGGVFHATEVTDGLQPAGVWTAMVFGGQVAMGFPGATPARGANRPKGDIPLACEWFTIVADKR
jgi:hypothetical protein